MPQILSAAQKHAPKIFTETCLINWENELNSIHNLVRGTSARALTRSPPASKNYFGKIRTICEHF
jgi:methionyl-tRNA formyltransferase